MPHILNNKEIQGKPNSAIYKSLNSVLNQVKMISKSQILLVQDSYNILKEQKKLTQLHQPLKLHLLKLTEKLHLYHQNYSAAQRLSKKTQSLKRLKKALFDLKKLK